MGGGILFTEDNPDSADRGGVVIDDALVVVASGGTRAGG